MSAPLSPDAQFHWNPLLERVNDLLFGCMDYESTVSTIAHLAAEVCDGWCAVDLVEEDGSIVRAAVAHKDPEKSALAEKMKRKYPASPRAKRGIYASIATGKTFVLADWPAASWLSRADDEDHFQLISDMGSCSYLCLPLKTRDEIVGAIMLISVSRRFTDADVAMAEKLAQRFALAVDFARMFRRMNAAIVLRDDFISIAAHELRTPLTPMLLQTQLISRTLGRIELPADTKREIDRLLKASEKQVWKLNKLVNDMLDVSRLNTSQIELKLSPLDLAAFVPQVLEGLEPYARANGCVFEFTATETVCGYWDPAKIEQVILNLATNAIKFAPSTVVRLGAQLLPSDHAEFWIRDSGPGISEKDQTRIFERYERGSYRDTMKSKEGLGLGLFIAKGITECHGGKILLESAQGQGSVFRVQLPLAPN